MACRSVSNRCQRLAARRVTVVTSQPLLSKAGRTEHQLGLTQAHADIPKAGEQPRR